LFSAPLAPIPMLPAEVVVRKTTRSRRAPLSRGVCACDRRGDNKRMFSWPTLEQLLKCAG
jgi:hypothetical protein